MIVSLVEFVKKMVFVMPNYQVAILAKIKKNVMNYKTL